MTENVTRPVSTFSSEMRFFRLPSSSVLSTLKVALGDFGELGDTGLCGCSNNSSVDINFLTIHND